MMLVFSWLYSSFYFRVFFGQFNSLPIFQLFLLSHCLAIKLGCRHFALINKRDLPFLDTH